MSIFRVKVCGITRAEDAELSVDLGAWALGYNFHPESPRYIRPRTAAEIARALAGRAVEQVGVFVNSSADEVLAIAREVGLTQIQLHGDEDAVFCAMMSLPVIKAVHLEKDGDLALLAPFQDCVRSFLVDARTPQARGGTGRVADWGLALRARDQVGGRLILAGGIRPENAREAISKVGPEALDVCSGVEQSPGIKSEEKLRALFAQLNGVGKVGVK